MTRYTARVRTVYFARAVGKSGPVKIGCTYALQTRLQQLRAVAQAPMELLAAIPGSIDDEHRIQSLFWHDRIHGEWFRWSRGLQILIGAAARGELDLEALPPTRVRQMPERRRSEEWKARMRIAREAKAA